MLRFTRRTCLLRAGFLLLASGAMAQTDIPIGSWRLHLSYNNIRAVEVTASSVLAASESGILIFDREEQSLHTLDKLNGLSGTGITCLRYDGKTDQLLVGYEEGDIDIIRPGDIINFSRLKNADVTAPKKINHITVAGDFAYLSTAYGVVVFDLQQLEVKETWRDLGADGAGLAVYQSTFFRDSIYLATAHGVLAGHTGDNLLDYNNWERFDAGDFSGDITSLATFNGKIYAAGTTGLYRLGDDWIQEPVADTVSIESLSSSSASLFMIIDSSIWMMNASGEVSKLEGSLLQAPAVVRQDEAGFLWIGDRAAGLVSNRTGAFSSSLPNGPSRTQVHRLAYHEGKVFVLSGGFSPSGQALQVSGAVDIFENGEWRTEQKPTVDITAIAFQGNSTYVASFGSGLHITDPSGNTTVLDETNSPLRHATGNRSNITALASSADGLWVTNYGGQQPLHLLKSDGTWDSYSFGFPNQGNPTALAVDGAGNVWMALHPATGGGLIVLDRATLQGYYRSDADGQGDLPHKNVNALARDRDGYPWVGTDAGIGYFFAPREDAIKPVFESRFLLRDEKINAIETDAGNRKWIGTDEGVWLFSETGEALVHHFTRDNSPLISNIIRDIEIHSLSGEVFFATDKGIISYRSDAVTPETSFVALRIFPNPVSPGYSGSVGISGLTDNAIVKITDISGRLLWQTQANGGMASWNVRDQEGRRASTGVYLVFATTRDGRESVVGKIAVID